MNDIKQQINLLTETRWIVLIPVTAIDKNETNRTIGFNLSNFTIGGLSIAYNSVSALGYNVDMPANVRNHDKTITFNYLLDSNLKQYAFLYNWFSKIAIQEGSGIPANVLYKDFAVPIRVIILSEFKQPIVEITYTDSWLSGLGEIDLNYQTTDSNPIKSNFTVKYTNIEFNWDPKY